MDRLQYTYFSNSYSTAVSITNSETSNNATKCLGDPTFFFQIVQNNTHISLTFLKRKKEEEREVIGLFSFS